MNNTFKISLAQWQHVNRFLTNVILLYHIFFDLKQKNALMSSDKPGPWLGNQERSLGEERRLDSREPRSNRGHQDFRLCGSGQFWFGFSVQFFGSVQKLNLRKRDSEDYHQLKALSMRAFISVLDEIAYGFRRFSARFFSFLIGPYAPSSKYSPVTACPQPCCKMRKCRPCLYNFYVARRSTYLSTVLKGSRH